MTNVPDFEGEELTAEEAERFWRAATDLRELREYTARYIEERFPFSPRFGHTTPHTETGQIQEELAILNRWGFWTYDSQPGRETRTTDGGRWQQRAYVCGFAHGEVAERIIGATLESDVVVYQLGPRAERTRSLRIPVSQKDGQAQTRIGRPDHPGMMINSSQDDSLKAEILSLYSIEAFDPQWGRSDVLWERLLSRLQ